MARTTLSFLWAAFCKSWLTIELCLSKDERMSGNTLHFPMQLIPSEMFLEQKRYKDSSSWIKFEMISSISFFIHYFCHMESILSNTTFPHLLSQFFFSLQRHSQLFDICLCILSNILFLLPLNFSVLFSISHHRN